MTELRHTRLTDPKLRLGRSDCALLFALKFALDHVNGLKPDQSYKYNPPVWAL